MGEVVRLPERIPILDAPEVELPVEAVVRADLNPLFVRACRLVDRHREASAEINELSAQILSLLKDRDISVAILSLYSCVDSISSSWLSHLERRNPGCSTELLTGYSDRQKSGARTPSPWRRLSPSGFWRGLLSWFRSSSDSEPVNS